MSPTRLFSSRICKIFKNTYFEENLWATASETCSNFIRTALFWYFALLSQISTYALALHHNLQLRLPILPSLLLIRWCSAKKVFLQISQNSQGNICATDSLLMKLQICRVLLYQKGFWHRCFLVNSPKFLITRFLKNPSDGCFCINTRAVHCPTATFCFFKNDVTHIFRLSIFSASFKDLEEE